MLARSLAEIYHDCPYWCDKGTDHSYIDIYEQLFQPFRQLPVTLLELGVKAGGSMWLWHHYFERGKIFGIDFNEVDLNLPQVTLRTGDATSKNDLDLVFGTQTFDIIIDDAGNDHQFEPQCSSLKALWERICSGGMYIIEDVQCIESVGRFAYPSPPTQVFDLRDNKGRHDDILLVWHKCKSV